jgi:proline dehydrogenase
VKGAYKEPKSIAYARKADVDAAYARMLKTLLTDGTYPPLRRTDPAMITSRAISRANAAAPIVSSSRCCTAFDAICRRRLLNDGYRMRVYVSVRPAMVSVLHARLGERPANVCSSLARSHLGEWVGRFHLSPRELHLDTALFITNSQLYVFST